MTGRNQKVHRPAIGMNDGRAIDLSPLLSRRELLLLTAGGLLMSSCTAVPDQPEVSVKGSPAQTSSPSPDATMSPGGRTGPLLDEFLAGTDSFFIAHRGSGDNWPEHTAYAYAQAAALGAKAIEVSLSSTSDGVLVCHHLTNTQNLTGTDWDIAEHSYAELEDLRNDARKWLGPASPLEPIPMLKDVLDAHAADYVLFIEDKQRTNTEALLELLDSYPDATQRFVWKQPGTVPLPEPVKERGYKTWGYFTDSSDNQFERFSAPFDLLGIYHDATDEEIRQLLSYGKPVICWEVHTRWMRDRLEGLGVRGMMCSNFPYVTGNGPHSTTDSFSSGLRAPGDLPWLHLWENQPALEPENASISITGEGSSSYVMGSMCPVTAPSYVLTFEVRRPGTPSQGNRESDWGAGVAFGQVDDHPFRPWSNVPVGGNFLSLSGDGRLELYRQDAGSTDPLPIASAWTAPPVPGQWMKFSLTVAPSTVRFARLDEGEIAAEAIDHTYRGGYFSLYKSHPGSDPVEFRAISVNPA